MKVSLSSEEQKEEEIDTEGTEDDKVEADWDFDKDGDTGMEISFDGADVCFNGPDVSFERLDVSFDGPDENNTIADENNTIAECEQLLAIANSRIKFLEEENESLRKGEKGKKVLIFNNYFFCVFSTGSQPSSGKKRRRS